MKCIVVVVALSIFGVLISGSRVAYAEHRDSNNVTRAGQKGEKLPSEDVNDILKAAQEGSVHLTV